MLEKIIIRRLPKSLRCICLVVLPILSLISFVILFVATPLSFSECLFASCFPMLLGFCLFVARLSYELNGGLFEGDGITIYWGHRILRWIPYQFIQGITVETLSTVGRFSSVMYDNNKKPRGVLCLYQSDCSFLDRTTSDSVNYISGLIDDNFLGSCFLKKRDLWALLCKTEVPIYITEQILAAHLEELKSLVEVYAERFVVAYHDTRTGKEKKAPYAEYKKYRATIT